VTGVLSLSLGRELTLLGELCECFLADFDSPGGGGGGSRGVQGSPVGTLSNVSNAIGLAAMLVSTDDGR
jgi:hypothetical protein